MLPEPILLFGASGQIGRWLRMSLGKKVIALTSYDVDFREPDKLASTIRDYSPKIIINAAAATSVDAIEDEESIAHLINADSPRVLAAVAKHLDIPFVHYSTDYVFSGEGDKPWEEVDIPFPLNAYGRTKFAGEKEIQDVGGKYLILRTSWLYSDQGRNFVNTMLHLGKEREVISVVEDQIGAPTYAEDAAAATIKILEAALDKTEFPSGIYHMCSSGETSWFKFTEEIFKLALENGVEIEAKEILPCKSIDFPTKAVRPLNSRLDCSKLRDTFGVELPDWKDGLKRCVKRISESFNG